MLSRSPFVCPPNLLCSARSGRPVPTALVGAAGRLALESARHAVDASLIDPTLVGERNVIKAMASAIGWNIADVRIVDTGDEATAAEAAVALARGGEVAALMKGHIHTDVLMRAVFNRKLGLRTGRRISHAFHMSRPERDGAIVITDAAVNVAPDVGGRIDIANNAVGLLHALGESEPKVAVLSATELPLHTMPTSLEATEIVRRAAQGEIADAVVDGPLALDSAISPEAAEIKNIDSPVAGCADILLVPNIETGNALFKAMVYYMSATAAGLVLGAKVPITLTSRADPPEARLAATALAAIIASAQV